MAEVIKDVRIVEVSPRDGLQSETLQLPTPVKLELIQRLVAAGLKEIEVTAFVRPERLPQLADAEALCQQLKGLEGVRFSALVPNLQGLQRAQTAGIHAIAFFTAASETFCQQNIGCSIAHSLARCEAVLEQFKVHHGGWMRAYISCAFGCPYEGNVDPARVSELASKLANLGCDEIVLADTIGVATPQITRQLVQAVAQQMPVQRLALRGGDGNCVSNLRVSRACASLRWCPIYRDCSGRRPLAYMPLPFSLLLAKPFASKISVARLRTL